MEIRFTIPQRVDLRGASVTLAYDAPLALGDSGAHLWQIEVTSDGNSVDLSGYSASLEGVRSDGGAVSQAGTVNGSTASVVLPAAAYKTAGVLTAAMKLTGTGGQVVTLARLRARVTDISSMT